jgi:ABC-type phosphate transport system ATPase subunit
MGTPSNDPLEHVMRVVAEGFKHTTQAIQDLRVQQAQLQQQQYAHARAAYDGMSGCGKSRYVTSLVEMEKAKGEKGAQGRVADMLDLTPGRISQLVNSEKNRKNGK